MPALKDLCRRFAVTPNEQRWGALTKACAGIALGRFDDSLLQLDTLNLEYERSGVDISTDFIGHTRSGLIVIRRVCRGHSRDRAGNLETGTGKPKRLGSQTICGSNLPASTSKF